MMYDGFWIEKNMGNNAIAYKKRKEFFDNPKLFVPKLVIGNIYDVKIGKKTVFEEIDNNGKVKSFRGLENLVQIEFEGQYIYIMDNHNHALYFWAKEILGGTVEKGISVVHLDQHSDMNESENIEILHKNMKLKEVFDYTNFVCNVGNFIIPAQKIGLVDKVYQIRTEYGLLNFELPEEKFILDIDLDFWATEMGIIEFEKTINMVKKLLKKAKFVTIATSPYFLEQERALDVLKRILS